MNHRELYKNLTLNDTGDVSRECSKNGGQVAWFLLQFPLTYGVASLAITA
jgi:hypothetical protein